MFKLFLLSTTPHHISTIHPTHTSTIKLRVLGHIFHCLININSNRIIVIKILFNFDHVYNTSKRYENDQNKYMNQISAKNLSNAVTSFHWLFIKFANDQKGPLIMIIKHIHFIAITHNFLYHNGLMLVWILHFIII